jgi:hypothetical protein
MPEIGQQLPCPVCKTGTMTWQFVRVPSTHFVDPYQPEGIEPVLPDEVPDYFAWVCNNLQCGNEDRKEAPDAS